MPNQRQIQPFQIEELKLSVGFLRGYAPSTETVKHTVVVRDDNNVVKLYALEVESTINGDFAGDFEGTTKGTFEGSATGTFEGSFIGTLDATSITAETINISKYAKIPKIEGSLQGFFTGTSQGDHYGNFNGSFTGSSYGSVHGDIEGNLTGNTSGTHVGPVQGEVVGSLIGDVVGDLTGNVEGDVKGNVEGDLYGNADTATKLKNPFTLTIAGNVIGTASIDGSSNVTIQTTLDEDAEVKVKKLTTSDSIIFGSRSTVSYSGDSGTGTFATIRIDGSSAVLDLTSKVLQEGKTIYHEDGQTVKVTDGGTGTTSVTGMVKGNGTSAFTAATPGEDYVTRDSVDILSNKTINLNGNGNTITNLTAAAFSSDALSLVFSDGTGSDDKIPTEKAVKAYVESLYSGLVWKEEVRVATTANVNLGTDVLDGSTLDGVVLTAGDRILVKNQTLSEDNGIYVVGTRSTERATDADTAAELTGIAVFVKEGTVNQSTSWVCSESITALGASHISFSQFSGNSNVTPGLGLTLSGNVLSINGSVVTLSGTQTLTNKVIYGTFYGNVSGSSTSCTGNAVTATTATNVSGGTVNAQSGTFSGTVTWNDGNSTKANTAYAERHQWDGASINLNASLGRTSLGLGGMATQNPNTVNITGGKIVGVDPISMSSGGTGTDLSSVIGILKSDGETISKAEEGVDYVSIDSSDVLRNKTLYGSDNTLRDFDLSIFTDGVIDSSPTLIGNSDKKVPTQRAVKEYVTNALLGAIWRTPVRCATTESVTIAEDLQIGKEIDGVLLKDGDRVLVKDQTLSQENGIYVVSSSYISRADDLSSGSDFYKSTVMVLEGAENAGTTWTCITDNITEWSTPITWSFYGSISYVAGEGLTYDGSSIVPDFDILLGVSKTQNVYSKSLDAGSVVFSNLSSIPGKLKFLLDNKGTVTIASESTEDKTYYLPKNSGTLYGNGSQIIPVTDGGTGLGTLTKNSILLADSASTFSLLTLSSSAIELLQSDVETYVRSISGSSEASGSSRVTIYAYTSHNELPDIQGGNYLERYHLSKTERDELTSGGQTRLHYHSHSDFSNLHGGGDYHLSSDQYSELTGEGVTSLHFHNHNTANNLQGGSGNERYHLTKDQHDYLTSGESIDIHAHSHMNLSDLNGSSDGYHLSLEDYQKVVAGNFGVQNHEDFADLQGGVTGQHYHLSLEKYQQITNFTGEIGKHNGLTDLQGGDSENEEFYHLTEDEWNYIVGQIAQGISHDSLKDILGGGSHHLSQDQYSSLTSGGTTNLHYHAEYLRLDGTNKLTSKVEGVLPTLPNHLATKEYVDSTLSGLKWTEYVIGSTETDPTNIETELGDRFLVPQNAVGEWENQFGKIAIVAENGWSFETAQTGTAVFDTETNKYFVWNGSTWITLSFGVKLHSDLGALYGGNWHLSEDQYTSLVNGDSSALHYHDSDRALSNATGVLSVEHGGIGLSAIPEGKFLYSTAANTLGTATITQLGRNILAASSLSSLKSIFQYGTMASQNASAVNITGGKISGIEPLGVEYGGTGASALSGILKGNGTGAFSTATPGVDYVTPAGAVELSNKTIVANSNGNKISGLNLSNFATGIVSTDQNLSTATDSKIATALAVKRYIDSLVIGTKNGVHGILDSSHKFSGALADSILVFTGEQSTPAQYFVLTESDSIGITLENKKAVFALKNSLSSIEKIAFKDNESTDASPSITSDADLDIVAEEDLNVTADNVTVNSEKTTLNSDVVANRTVSIKPALLEYSSSVLEYRQRTVSSLSSIVILSSSEEIGNGVLSFVLTKPEDVPGCIIKIKTTNIQNVIIRVEDNSSTIDGEAEYQTSITYQTVTFYSTGEEWLIL